MKTEHLHSPHVTRLRNVCMKHWSALRGFRRQVSKQMEAESRVMQFMGMSDAGGDTGREEGEAPVSISSHPRQCPTPPPHNLTNIKSRHGTKTPPISSAVRAPLSAQCMLQVFSCFCPSLSGLLLAPTHLHRYRLALAWADVGSSHVMLLTATRTQLPLWQTRI